MGQTGQAASASTITNQKSLVSHNITLFSGTITSIEHVDVLNTFTWNAGTITGSGYFYVHQFFEMVTAGTKTLTSSISIVNLFSGEWIAGQLSPSNTSQIVNANNATFVQWDTMSQSSNTSAFVNDGLLFKRGTGTATHSWLFINYGDVIVEQGTLKLARDVHNYGYHYLHENTVLLLLDNTATTYHRYFYENSTVEGPGSLIGQRGHAHFNGFLNITGEFRTGPANHNSYPPHFFFYPTVLFSHFMIEHAHLDIQTRGRTTICNLFHHSFVDIQIASSSFAVLNMDNSSIILSHLYVHGNIRANTSYAPKPDGVFTVTGLFEVGSNCDIRDDIHLILLNQTVIQPGGTIGIHYGPIIENYGTFNFESNRIYSLRTTYINRGDWIMNGAGISLDPLTHSHIASHFYNYGNLYGRSSTTAVLNVLAHNHGNVYVETGLLQFGFTQAYNDFSYSTGIYHVETDATLELSTTFYEESCIIHGDGNIVFVQYSSSFSMASTTLLDQLGSMHLTLMVTLNSWAIILNLPLPLILMFLFITLLLVL
ncbi:hypothetical protein GEMRC1_005707 [Eukaryota sp. GEM-RC1]